MPLAELNIAVPRYPLDDPRIADFMDNLNRINGLAHRTPGFVRMHKDDSGHAFGWSHLPSVKLWRTRRCG